MTSAALASRLVELDKVLAPFTMPVSARTSVDLPWSTWPAVPMIATLLPECGDEDVGNCQIVFGINDGARVENKAPVVDTADYCGCTPPETRRERRR